MSVCVWANALSQQRVPSVSCQLCVVARVQDSMHRHVTLAGCGCSGDTEAQCVLT